MNTDLQVLTLHYVYIMHPLSILDSTETSFSFQLRILIFVKYVVTYITSIETQDDVCSTQHLCNLTGAHY